MNTKTKIFFDTNILEIRESKELTSVSEFVVSNDYYSIMKFIHDNELERYVEVHIPKIVLMEMRFHLLECQKSSHDSLCAAIAKGRKVFNDLLNIDISFNYGVSDEDDHSINYEEYLERIINGFITLPINRMLLVITPLPQRYDDIIDRAVSSILPFFAIKNHDVSDAGFKDAVLLESILNNVDLLSESAILITKDRHFHEDTIINNIPGRESFIVVDKTEAAIEILKKTFAISIQNEIVRQLQKPYYLSRLLENINQRISSDTERLYIDTIESDENEENLYIVEAHCTINEAIYNFRFSFDTIANDFTNIEYFIKND